MATYSMKRHRAELLIVLLFTACKGPPPHYRTPLEEMKRLEQPEPVECQPVDSTYTVCSSKYYLYRCTTVEGQHSSCTIYQ